MSASMVSLKCCQLLLLVAMVSAYNYERDGREFADNLDEPARESFHRQNYEDSPNNSEKRYQADANESPFEDSEPRRVRSEETNSRNDNPFIDGKVWWGGKDEPETQYKNEMNRDLENIEETNSRNDNRESDHRFENTIANNDQENSLKDDQYQSPDFRREPMDNELQSDPAVRTRIANWWNTFDHGGLSKCAPNTYLTGLWRSARHRPDRLGLLEQGDCKSTPFPSNGYSRCYKLNIWHSFDRKGWAQCRRGYFIQSITSTRGKGLHNIEELHCCKPKASIQGRCHKENVWRSFDHKGWSRCRAGTYMQGIFRNTCDQLFCLEEFRCCSMKQSIPNPGRIAVSRANWWHSFDRQGWSTCPAGQYITGFYRSARRIPDGIWRLEEAKCKSAPLGWVPRRQQQCYKLNIWSSFDRKGWGKCKHGYYMQGIYRTNGRNLHNIEEFRCCKPKNHHVVQRSCRKQNVWHSFDRKGWSQCPGNTYMTGIWRNNCNWLYCIEEFECCSMKYV
ncbi:uncharacterized protein [Clytia hemisphaerica]